MNFRQKFLGTDKLTINTNNLTEEKIYLYFKEELDKINFILGNVEQNNGLKYYTALENKKTIEKEFQEYLELKNKEFFNYGDFSNKDKINFENIYSYLEDVISDIERFLLLTYDIHLEINSLELGKIRKNVKIKDDITNFELLEDKIAESIDNVGGVVSIKEFNNLVSKIFLEPILNFLYFYEGKILELQSNPQNKLILKYIGNDFELYTEKYIKEEIKQKKQNYIQAKQQYDEAQKSQKYVLKKSKNKESNYLENRQNPEIKLAEIQEAKGNTPQQKRLAEIKNLIGPERLEGIKNYANLPSELKDLERYFKNKKY